MRFRNDLNVDFTVDAQRNVREFLNEEKEHRYADAWLIGKAVVLFGLFSLSYVSALVAPLPAWGHFLCAVNAGVMSLLLAINVGHDAAHDCFVRPAWGNRLLQRATFTFLGIDAYLWKFRHIRSHHPFPNINGCDIDIDQNPFFRLSPNQPSRRYFRWQYIYAPFVYGLVVLHTVFVQDFMYLYQKRIANIQNINHPPSAHLMFYLSKILFLVLVFGLPLLLTSYGLAAIGLTYLAVSALVSLLFVLLLVGTHFAVGVSFPEVQADGTLPCSQAVHAVESSQDWCTQSRVAAFLTGGANCHAAHHLFPKISHRHYKALTPIIEKSACRHGVRYRKTAFRGLVASHVRFLRSLANTHQARSNYK